MQLSKVNNKDRYRLAARLSFKSSSNRRYVAWAHAHVVLKSHGCTASPSWIAPPPLPSPPNFSRRLSVWRLPRRLAGGAHCWVAGNPSHGSANQPLNTPGTQPSFRNVVADAQRTLTISLPFRAFALWVVFEIEWEIFIKLLWRWSQTLALIHTRWTMRIHNCKTGAKSEIRRLV